MTIVIMVYPSRTLSEKFIVEEICFSFTKENKYVFLVR